MISVGEILRSNPAYRELLHEDGWKNFSREVKQQFGGACQCCKRKDIETHVHHFFYNHSKPPEETERGQVIVLCKYCHEALHKELNRFRRIVFRKCPPQAFAALNTALAIGLRVNDPLKFAYAIMEMACSPRSVEGFHNYWINRPEKDRPVLDEEQLT